MKSHDQILEDAFAGEEVHAEALQLRYQSDEGLEGLSVEASLRVLEGVRDLVRELYEGDAFGDGPRPRVEVRPTQEGSMIFDFVVWAAANKDVLLGAAGAVGTVGSAITAATKGRRAEVADFVDLPNGNKKLIFQDDTVAEVSPGAWEALNRRRKRTKGALHKIMNPVGREASTLEVRSQVGEEVDEQSTPELVADKADAQALLPEKDPAPKVRTFETEGQVTRIDYLETDKWRIATPEGRRQVTVLDKAFLNRVEKGLTVSKTDILWFKIRETVGVSRGRTSTTWEIMEVTSYRKAWRDD